MVLARALRHFSYREVYAPDAPFHVLYPPGYPAFLAGLTTVVGESFDVAALASVLFGVGTLALTFLIVRRVWSAWGATVVVGLLALNPFLVDVNSRPVSEPLFMLLSMAALYLALEPTRRNDVGAIVAATAATLVRGVGVPLLAGLGIYWLLQRRFRAAFLLAAVAGAAAGPWYVWTMVAPQKYVGASYAADFAQGDLQGQEGPFHADPGPRRAPPPLLLRAVTRIGRNGQMYAVSETPRQLGTPAIPGTPLDNLVFGSVMGVGLLVGLAVCWKRWNLGVLYAVAFGALLLVWPWVAGRFLIPLLPVLVALLVVGAATLGRRLWSRGEWVAVGAVAAVLLTGSAGRLVPLVKAGARCDRTDPLPRSPSCVDDRVGRLMDVVAYVRDSLPPEARLFTSQPHLVYLYSGRQAVQREPVATYDGEAFLDYLRRAGVEYLILSGVHPLDARKMPDLLEQVCGSFTVIRAYPPYNYLLRLEAPGSAPEPNACEAATRHAQAMRDVGL